MLEHNRTQASWKTQSSGVEKQLSARTIAKQMASGGNTGARDSTYYLADNDADNFDPTLNSSHADYYKHPDSSAAYGEYRWKTGGGIDTGAATGLSMGKTRDTDGTVDRSPDPTPDLFPILFAVKMQASAYNIDLDGTFEAAGGSARGTIPATRFNSALSAAFHRLEFTEADFSRIGNHYGTGARAPKGSAKEIAAPFECVAWKGTRVCRHRRCCARLRRAFSPPADVRATLLHDCRFHRGREEGARSLCERTSSAGRPQAHVPTRRAVRLSARAQRSPLSPCSLRRAGAPRGQRRRGGSCTTRRDL